MYQVHNQSKTQYLNLLDKCTQIIREDRIWLRNLIKANNEEALNLFRGIPKNMDMKDLQIKLRKYIMRTKQREKQQQLQRFKQNMHLPDFVQTASERRPQIYNKSQNKLRTPLNENQGNQSKSSFVAKWNNYTHYNQPVSIAQHKNQASYNFPSSSLQKPHSTTKSSKNQWSNNYKPHSFNRHLNGELANKLGFNSRMNSRNEHNRSVGNLNRNGNLSMSNLSKGKWERNIVDNGQDAMSLSQKLNNGRTSSKSLRQLENKIYEELRQFQQTKTKRQAQNLNKTYSQRSVERHQQSLYPNTQNNPKPIAILPQPTKPTISKQNIDEILRNKLGNCDFQSYKKHQTSQNEQQHDCYIKQNELQKKLYHQGLFPPIEEQTQRDSESQRYPEDPWRFGLSNNNVANSKFQLQDRHKVTFASFAKQSPDQSRHTFKSYEFSDKKNISDKKETLVPEFFHDSLTHTQTVPQIKRNFIDDTSNNFNKFNYEQPQNKKLVRQSPYQSAQKKNQFSGDFIESDLHKKIINSIRKSRQLYPTDIIPNESSLKHSNAESFQRINDNNTMSASREHFGNSQSKVQELCNFHPSLFASTSNDGLFTSPQLLNECRNFLKKTQQINFENSGLGNVNTSFNPQPHKFQSPTNSQQKSFKDNFSSFNNMLNFPQPITITQSITKDYYDHQKDSYSKINSLFESKQSSVQKNIQFETYSKPQQFRMESSFKKSDFNESSIKKSDVLNQMNNSLSKKQESGMYKNSRGNSSVKKHSQIEQTIALPAQQLNFNTSNNNSITKVPQILPQSQEIHDKYKISQFTNAPKQQSIRKMTKSEKNIWDLIQLEDIVDKILQANQGNIEVQSIWLKHTVQNHCIFAQQIGNLLINILNPFISANSTFNLMEIITHIQSHYRKNPNHQNRKCPPRDICFLLDIDQKGFINYEDIRNFIEQLQSAEVQNLEEIKSNLLEVFDIADFMGEKQISYLSLYVIKNQDCFERLCGNLDQFEFEIDNENGE